MIDINNTYKDTYFLENIEDLDGNRIKDPYDTITIENEVANARFLSIENHGGFLARRIAVLDAYREIFNEEFKFKSGVEFGCGAYGWMYNFLIPKSIDWTQYDINPKAVDTNLKFSKINLRHKPKVEIGNIYDMPLDDSSVDLITGFSSWDSLYFLEKSVEELSRCLKKGGYFFHFQDVGPAEIPLIMRESKIRTDKGLSRDVPCRFYRETIPHDLPGFYETQDYMTHIYSEDFGLVRFGEYLHKNIAKLLKNNNFTIHKCKEEQKNVLIKERNHKKRLKSLGNKLSNGDNWCGHAYGLFKSQYDSSVPKKYINQYSAIDVLIAQKN